MSNVLIGIIGVILFIGLALAGALFLGPRFQQSTNNAKASASVQAVGQVASAANMANVQSGSTTQAQTVDMTTTTGIGYNGYLKAVPANPVTSGNTPTIVSSAGAATGDGKFAVMDLGNNADAVCTAIAVQTGQAPAATTSPTVGTATDLGNLASTSGCFKTTAAVGSLATGKYIAFATI